MWKINLQSPPSRPPPPFDPVVEAWLDSLPPPEAAPSRKDLKQWRLTNYHGLGRSVFVTCIILRVVSLATSLSVIGLTASAVTERQGPFAAFERLVPCLVVCPVVALWNTAEFVAASVLQDGGLPPNVHVVVDGFLFLGLATAMGTLLVDIICGVTDYPSTFGSAAEEISSVCLLVVLMVIHSFLLFFFICNYVDSTRKRARLVIGHSATSRDARFAIQQPGAKQATDIAGPPTTPETAKVEQITTTLELEEFNPKSPSEQPEFGILVHPKSTCDLAPATALESSTLAQAMSGLWYVDAETSYQPRPPGKYEGGIRSEAHQQPSLMGRYM